MSLLREYIKAILREVEVTHDGAGVIVVKKFGDDWKVLGLKTKEGMDIPKGQADPGESPFETALRETEEESSLSKDDLSFEWGEDPLIIDSRLFLYVASTSKEPKIQRNPETGELEHEEVSWLSFDELERESLYYLVPGVSWARQKVNHSESSQT